MSNVPRESKGLGTRVIQGGVLALLFALLFVATRAVPESESSIDTVAAIGFLLLAGTLLSELLEPLGMPHLSGYLGAGILSGPYVLRLVDHETVTRLSSINGLALALIALAGGAELKLDDLRAGLRSLTIHTLVQHSLVLVTMTGVFMLAKPFVPFAREMSFGALFGVALLWGAVSVTRSPSATLGILSQTRASGPLAAFSLRFVMASDLVVVCLLATVMMVARPLLEPSASFSVAEFKRLGYEILGSVSLGTTMGLLLAVYLRLIGTQLIVVLIALGFGATEVMHYLGLEPLLGFMIAGFVVQNLSRQGEKFLHAIEQMGGVVFVLFFATAGAHLDVPILRRLWPLAMGLTLARVLATWLANRIASASANDPEVIRRWGWSGLVSQAGIALGMAMLVGRNFPGIGREFQALAIAAVAINEMVGPVLFKMALDRTGETSAKQVAMRMSIRPPPIVPEGSD